MADHIAQRVIRALQQNPEGFCEEVGRQLARTWRRGFTVGLSVGIILGGMLAWWVSGG